MTVKTLHGFKEAELALLQNRQVGNTCTLHAITTSLRLLLGFNLDPMALSEEVDQLWWRGKLMRVFPGWAVTPKGQVRILRYIAKTRGLAVNAVFHKGIPEILPGTLSDDTVIPIITLTWLWRQAPPIFYGEDPSKLNTSNKPGGHSMILAAYDPDHAVGGTIAAPWGFINPWRNQANRLYWMQDHDFRNAWRFKVPFNGPNPLVLIYRTTF